MQAPPMAAAGTGGVPMQGSGGQTLSNPATGGAGSAGGAPMQGSGGTMPQAHDAAVADAALDAGSSDACDRMCLLAVMQSYLEALVAHDPAKAAFAADPKYTANGVAAELGDGFWKTASRLAVDERLDYADPEAGQVGSQLVIDEGSAQVIYEVRLKVVAHEITEIEAMEVRQADAANGFFTPANMKPQPVFVQAIEPAKRMTRDQLKMVVDKYIQYLDGKLGGGDVPFDEQLCALRERLPHRDGTVVISVAELELRCRRPLSRIRRRSRHRLGHVPLHA